MMFGSSGWLSTIWLWICGAVASTLMMISGDLKSSRLPSILNMNVLIPFKSHTVVMKVLLWKWVLIPFIMDGVLCLGQDLSYLLQDLCSFGNTWLISSWINCQTSKIWNGSVFRPSNSAPYAYYSRDTYSRSGPHRQGTGISIELGLNFNQAGTNSAMTHVLILSAKGRRNEWLWQTLDIGNMFGPTFDFRIP